MTNNYVLNIYKPISLTPLDAIHKLRQKFPELENETLAYAGRLDPMAEGVLLVLVGDECKKRKEYERLKKVYEVEILWGVSTDTYDVMGLITDINTQAHPKDVLAASKSFIGKQLQPYPPYSSARVNGKPLYYWARENRLDKIEIPSKEVEIFDITYIGERSVLGKEILKEINQKINKVQGKFRQDEILNKWHNILLEISDFEFRISNISVSCSSGTYMRSLAYEIGKTLRIPTLAYSIKRTQVDRFSIKDSIKL
jgi:tRNA pseudouridine(55) synthase